GFGVCRDLEGLTRLEMLRSQEFFNDPPSADMMSPEIGRANLEPSAPPALPVHLADTGANSTAPVPSEPTPTILETPVEKPEEVSKDVPAQAAESASPNVVPFRPIGEARTP